METRNYIHELNEYAMKHHFERKFDGSAAGPVHNQTFTQWVVLNGKVYPNGVGKTKKEAKRNAAKNALESLLENPDQETAAEEKHCTSGQQKDEIDQIVLDISKSFRRHKAKQREGEADFISMVAQYCQKTNRCHSYIEVKRRGPSHCPQFFYKVLIDQRFYPEGEGKTVKEAKRNAARLAWSALQEQSDWDSKVSINSTASEDCGPSMLPCQLTTQESHESSSESRPMDTGSPITFPDTSNPSRAQISFLPAASGDGVFDKLSATSSLESPASSQSPSTGTSSSVIFTDSSNSSRDQIKSPDLKTKIRIAANFPNARRNSKEDEMPNFSGKNPERSPSKKTTTQPRESRFTSDFDSIVSLGKGTFGHVYKAENKLLRKGFAIKIVRCKEIKKALREVKVLSDLNHCNIVRYYSCWLEDSGYQGDSADDSSSSSQSSGNSSVKYLYIQMELCSTRTLRVWIDEKNLLNVKKSLRDSKRREESLTIAQQIVCAVEYIHTKMLIHRDLKPANLLFGPDGEVKIGDFGLVTEENNDDAENILERTVYMAPEQRSRSLTYDRKVDIFAFGLIYFELLWNIPVGQERSMIMDEARNQKFPDRFSSSFILEVKIIKSMLSAKPEDRPEASQLQMDLELCSQTLKRLKDTCCDSRTV